MEQHKSTIGQQLPVFFAQLLLCGAMLGIYGLLGRLSWAVVLGAAAGALVSMLNHLGLILSLLKAEQSESPEKGQLKARGNYLLRMLLMVVLLVLAIKLGKTDPIATLLPLILMRIALFIGSLMIQKEGK